MYCVISKKTIFFSFKNSGKLELGKEEKMESLCLSREKARCEFSFFLRQMVNVLDRTAGWIMKEVTSVDAMNKLIDLPLPAFI